MLNNVVGGLNPYAVEHTAAMGGKIVWMPTLAGREPLEVGEDVRLGPSGLDAEDAAGERRPGAR